MSEEEDKPAGEKEKAGEVPSQQTDSTKETSESTGNDEQKKDQGDQGESARVVNPDQILDQSDIDALLNETVEEVDSAIYKNGGGCYSPDDKIVVKAYDFRSPPFLTKADLRQLRLTYEQYVHYLSAKLTMAMQIEVKLALKKLNMISYEKLVEEVSAPSHISLFKVNELRGIGLVNMQVTLAMAIVNKMLGGKAKKVANERPLTEIEIALINEVVQIMLDDWSGLWRDYKDLNISMIGQENDARFLQTSAYDALMIVIDVEMIMGECMDNIQIAVPYQMLDPVIKFYQAKRERVNGENEQNLSRTWKETYREISVPIYAEWDLDDLTVRDVLNLSVGDVIELPKSMVQDTRLRLRDVYSFVGEAGIEGENVVVKISNKFEKKENDE